MSQTAQNEIENQITRINVGLANQSYQLERKATETFQIRSLQQIPVLVQTFFDKYGIKNYDERFEDRVYKGHVAALCRYVVTVSNEKKSYTRVFYYETTVMDPTASERVKSLFVNVAPRYLLKIFFICASFDGHHYDGRAAVSKMSLRDFKTHANNALSYSNIINHTCESVDECDAMAIALNVHKEFGTPDEYATVAEARTALINLLTKKEDNITVGMLLEAIDPAKHFLLSIEF